MEIANLHNLIIGVISFVLACLVLIRAVPYFAHHKGFPDHAIAMWFFSIGFGFLGLANIGIGMKWAIAPHVHFLSDSLFLGGIAILWVVAEIKYFSKHKPGKKKKD
jgi:hypothetical protein